MEHNYNNAMPFIRIATVVPIPRIFHCPYPRVYYSTGFHSFLPFIPPQIQSYQIHTYFPINANLAIQRQPFEFAPRHITDDDERSIVGADGNTELMPMAEFGNSSVGADGYTEPMPMEEFGNSSIGANGNTELMPLEEFGNSSVGADGNTEPMPMAELGNSSVGADGNAELMPMAEFGDSGVGTDGNTELMPMAEFGNSSVGTDAYTEPMPMEEFGNLTSGANGNTEPMPMEGFGNSSVGADGYTELMPMEEFGNSSVGIDGYTEPMPMDEFGNASGGANGYAEPMPMEEFGNGLESNPTGYNHQGQLITYIGTGIESSPIHQNSEEIRIGPPVNHRGPPPSSASEIFVTHLPKMAKAEEKVYDLFSKIGPIYLIEIKLKCRRKKSKTYCFVHYYNVRDARRAIQELNGYKFKTTHFQPIAVEKSYHSKRLFISGFPNHMDAKYIFELASNKSELSHLVKVVCPTITEFPFKNRGFCYFEFQNHKFAGVAFRTISQNPGLLFGPEKEVFVQWAKPRKPHKISNGQTEALDEPV